jgi:hypothetical protein
VIFTPPSHPTRHHNFKEHITAATQHLQARCPSTARHPKQRQNPAHSNFTRNDPSRITPPRRTLTSASRRTTRRTGATTTFAATTPGAHSDSAIPNIRHNGPNTRRACGEAAINPAISGSANSPRICPAKQAASPGTNGNNHPNPRGNPGLATRAARTPRNGRGTSRTTNRPACNRANNPRIRRSTPRTRCQINRIIAAPITPATTRAATARPNPSSEVANRSVTEMAPETFMVKS